MKLVPLLVLVLTIFTGCKESEKKSQLVVAKVGEIALTSKDFADMLAFRLRNFDALSVKSSKNVDRVKEEVVNDFILRTITETWAKEAKVEIKEEEVSQAIEEIRSNYPDDLAFRRSLAGEHLSFEKWKNDLVYSVLQKRVIQQLSSNLPPVSDQEVTEYYQRNKVRFNRNKQIKIQQIVVKERETAERLLKELKKSSSMDEMAKQYSIAPEARDAGITGWIDVDTLDIFQKAYNLPKNGPVKMLKSPFGYHLLKVVDKKDEGVVSLEEAKNQIRNLLSEQREQQTYTNWLDQQLRRHKVYKDNLLISKIMVETKEN